MPYKLKILTLILLISNICFCQQFNPCHSISETSNGNIIVTFYKNCNDSTTFVKRSYTKEGIMWRNESYKNCLQHGTSWYTSSQDEGTQSHIYDNGIEIERIDYYPNSGVPKYSIKYLSDSVIYVNTYYPNGNPESNGYLITDSSGLEHKLGKWIEYDTLGYDYWLGDYKSTNIQKSDTIIDEEVGMTNIINWKITEVKHGKWTKFNLNGVEKEFVIYENGVAIKPKDD